jgi:tetratricopeptide (TPR) repeat protein/tRNA A-37 threonylcarbamoyl transferase component Bud32
MAHNIVGGVRNVRDPLPADRWSSINTLFGEALEKPSGERVSFVREACGDDRQLGDEIIQLLAYDTQEAAGSDSDLLTALQSEAHSVVADETVAGSILGPWRIDREIGRGGMAVVYLGSRADGAYRKQVAIKLIKRGMDTEAVVSRLRRERTILAALDHPYIARLLDGGATPDARPYIVMDYVEGLPISRYCDEHRLGIEERCRLMGRVCDAVAYAHRNLVVHRDLKPANILVTANGEPKLLDFGIAKLLSYEPGDDPLGPETRGAMRPLTPEYASPEQLSGGNVGTTTDVYSLGVVFYELLAGERPRGPVGLGHKASVVARHLGRGRRWSRQLAGDLDNILQMALRSEPERRYLSVGQLQADLSLHLKGLPVAAREETLLYRGGKFLSRHRWGTAAALLIIFSLAGGMAATLWQGRRAEAERLVAESRRIEAEREATLAAQAQRRAEGEHAEAEHQRVNADNQRVIADGERQIADRRFAQVRELAGKFLFDFNDSVASLPGSTPVRKTVVETGIRYYDSLVKEAGSNRDLLEEIARGYDRLGDVQGNPYYSNLGDVQGSVASYRKSLAIRGKISDPSPDFLRDRIMGNVKMGQILQFQGKYDESAQYLKQALAFAPAVKSQPATVRDALATAWGILGDTRMRAGDNAGGLQAYNKLLAMRQELAKESKPGDAFAIQRALSVAETKLGDYYFRNEVPEEALTHLNAARAIDLRLSEADPGNAALTRKLRVTDLILGSVLYGSGKHLAKPGEASAILQDAARLADRLLAADPSNSQVIEDSALTYTGLGDSLHSDRDLPGARAAWEKGMTVAQRLSASASDAGILSQLYRRLAISSSDDGKLDEALAGLRRAEELALSAEKDAPDTTMKTVRIADVNDTRADVYIAAKRRPDAIDAMKSNVAAYEDLAQRNPNDSLYRDSQPPIYVKLADCYYGAGDRENARKTLRIALDIYAAMEAKHPLTSADKQDRDDAQAKLAAWQPE